MCYVILRLIRELAILNRNSLFRLLSALAFFSGMVATADRTYSSIMSKNDWTLMIMTLQRCL
jgi:hypothetical protein